LADSHVHPSNAQRQSCSASRTSSPRWKGRLERHAHCTRRGRQLAGAPSNAHRRDLRDDMRNSRGRPKIEQKYAVDQTRSCKRRPRLAHGPPQTRHLRSRPEPKRAKSDVELDEELAPLNAPQRFEGGSGEHGSPSSLKQNSSTATVAACQMPPQAQIGLRSAESTRVLRCTMRANCAYHEAQRCCGVGRVRSERRRRPPATGKSRGCQQAIFLHHTPP